MTLKELTILVQEIRDNHLKHIADDMDQMDGKIDKIDQRLWAVVILLVASLVIPIAFSVIKDVI